MTSIVLAARGRITTHFGEDIGRGFPHRGIDQGHGDGNAIDLEIRAPADGVVTFAGPFGSYGNVLFITHSDGWVSVLAHHEKQFVAKGDRIKQRQLIAEMGNTGTIYVHNHQELRDAAGNQLDPLLHLSATAGSNLKPLEEEDMPLTNADAQTVMKTPIIVDKRWGGQASVAEVIAGTRARAEDVLNSNNRIEQKLDTLIALLNK